MLSFDDRKAAYMSCAWARDYYWMVEPNPLLSNHWWTNSILCLPYICKIQNTWVQKIPSHYICTLFALTFQIIPFPSHVLEALHFVQNCIVVLVVGYCCLKIWISFICYKKISWFVMCFPNPKPKCYFYNKEICTWSTLMYIKLVEKNDGAFVCAHMHNRMQL